jgi:hypothetical protein
MAPTGTRSINNFAISPHFSLYEFECRCCRRVLIENRLVRMLEELRGVWGRPLVITSGYRCERHNREVGGAVRSLHPLGRAADIDVDPSFQDEIVKIAVVLNFYEIIPNYRKGYIHLSCK